MKFHLWATESAPQLQKYTYCYYFNIAICVQDCDFFPGDILLGLARYGDKISLQIVYTLVL
jgi:hypothetical protein